MTNSESATADRTVTPMLGRGMASLKATTTQHFRFLDLPPELRNQVYRHYVGGPPGMEIEICDAIDFVPQSALSMTCRQIREESLELLDEARESFRQATVYVDVPSTVASLKVKDCADDLIRRYKAPHLTSLEFRLQTPAGPSFRLSVNVPYRIYPFFFEDPIVKSSFHGVEVQRRHLRGCDLKARRYFSCKEMQWRKTSKNPSTGEILPRRPWALDLHRCFPAFIDYVRDERFRLGQFLGQEIWR